ncbi:MAG: xanthine dehydrogenase, partial [Candidatus Thermofonsia Clade 1 bacterium]
AVLRAAAILRGEEVPPVEEDERAAPLPVDLLRPFGSDTPHVADDDGAAGSNGGTRTQTPVKPLVVPTTEIRDTAVIGKPEQKVDAVKLALGKPAFADDFELRGMLYGALMTSPHAHARIKQIDTSKAKAIPGIHPVLTYKNLPRVIYA